jgi:hypothetical protein
MPIIFPITVIEKIVEKIVEKTVYVVADLYAKISITYRYIQNAVLPSVNILAQTLTSISVAAREIFRPLYRVAVSITHSLIQNPTKPIANFIQMVTSVSAIARIYSKYASPHKAFTLVFSFIQNQVKPTVNFILGTTQLLLVRSVIGVKKPYPTHQLVSNPAKPSPAAVTQFNTSVGVRKTP